MNIVKHLDARHRDAAPTHYQSLKLSALDCYRVGATWATFWQKHGERVRQAEPYDIKRYRRLVRHLLALVVSGDTDGQQPIGDDDAMPWEEDDAKQSYGMAALSDSTTRAKCLVPLAIPNVVLGDRLGAMR